MSAPIWKAYLAVRTHTSAVDNQVQGNGSSGSMKQMKARKKTRHSSSSKKNTKKKLVSMSAIAPQPPSTAALDASTTHQRIGAYWARLSTDERQQILFVDQPEVVKQLYKLNLSLLCVGLMQRHLKTSQQKAAKNIDKESTAASSSTEETYTSLEKDIKQGSSKLQNVSTQSLDSDKAYELLEGMEFMEVGTGILTVKNELLEDPHRLIELADSVLPNFLTSVHILSTNHFTSLFVKDSETISSWEDYERLIAMLVEQLILKSYLSHLEEEARQQMESLLLEVSTKNEPKSSSSLKKKKKKSKKKKARTQRSQSPSQAAFPSSCNAPSCTASSSGEEDQLDNRSDSSVETVPTSATDTPIHSPSSLNPNASIFEPTDFNLGERSSFTGKRKLDSYIVDVNVQDALRDEDEEDEDDAAAYTDPAALVSDQQHLRTSATGRPQHEESSELAWQLEQVYSTTASTFGWDFNRQCEVPETPNVSWDDSTLWRTAPQDVVRFFTSGPAEPTSYRHAIDTPSTMSHSSQSRYYYAPPSPWVMPPTNGFYNVSDISSARANSSNNPMIVSAPDFVRNHSASGLEVISENAIVD